MDGGTVYIGMDYMPLHGAQLAYFEEADYQVEVVLNETDLGDVNGNGTVEVTDALRVAQYEEGMDGFPFYAAAADVNCYGVVTLDDANLIAAGGPFECP